MSQDFLVKLECAVCKRINYHTRRNKKLTKDPLKIKKHCKWCGQHTDHKELK